ncbi:MAG: signal recognition particle-docking protein FtsY [Deltaproteobacteria bacterium]|nr:signal recognition particle-docking protein FtsY [Deltaproteobacteria bacterium]
MILQKIKDFFSHPSKVQAYSLDQLEEVLLESDVGIQTTQALITSLRGKTNLAFEDVKNAFIQLWLPKLSSLERVIEPKTYPFVIMFIGINGSGKTTTLAKLAYQFKNHGKTVLAIAADTFRSAAREQLSSWAQKIGIEVFQGQKGADPSSVIYDGLKWARHQKSEVILIDTAGRLHTKVPLLEEMKKMKRVIQKVSLEASHEIWMVLDAHTGHNALNQCRQFHEALGVTGLIVTKMDGLAKTGMVLTLAEALALPIIYLGMGEKKEDLTPFKAQAFLERLFVF